MWGCKNITGVGWCDSQEFDFAPVVTVEQEVHVGYLVGQGWRVLQGP